MVVADSNRFSVNGSKGTLALVRLGDGGVPSLLGYLGSAVFPRDAAAAPGGGRAYVALFGSAEVETVNVAKAFGS